MSILDTLNPCKRDICLLICRCLRLLFVYLRKGKKPLIFGNFAANH